MGNRNLVMDAMLGVAVGDAVGVPVEFISREALLKQPVIGMRSQGTHNQVAGTWSDDSSLTFCLAEMLCSGYDLQNLANRFVNWKEHSYWTAYGRVFDIGIATSAAIHELSRGCRPELAGGMEEDSNGNGSLMRILPLVFYVKDMPIAERFRHVKEVSSLTHAHIRSIIACFIYIEYALQIMNGIDKHKALEVIRDTVNKFLSRTNVCPKNEINKFHRILLNPIGDYEIVPLEQLTEDEIYSSGYVLHTLEASIWCILHTGSYKEAVLKAVNLGKDTDTTAAVTGGLAGLLYGTDSIPDEWLQVLARKADIEDLATRLNEKIVTP